MEFFWLWYLGYWIFTLYFPLAGVLLGGGGFFMLYCPAKGRALDELMAKHDMPRVSYFPTLQGSKVVSDMTSFDDFDQA